MQRLGPLAFTLALLLSAPLARADILHLTDGSRLYGRLVRQDAREVVFAVVSADGRSSVERRFAAERVARIERTERMTPPKTSTADDAGRPDTGSQTDGVAGADDEAGAEDARLAEFEPRLREAFVLLDADSKRPALRLLQDIAADAAPATLERLDGLTRELRGQPLDELLAGLRIAYALEKDQGRVFRLGYATEYEKPALKRMLVQRQRELLGRGHLDRTVEGWAAEPDAYTELRPQAPHLVADARLAAGIIGERLRIDEALRRDPRQRREAVALRADLGRLVGHVERIRGYWDLLAADERNDPAAAMRRAMATSQPADDAASQPAKPEKRKRMPRSLFEDDPP